MTNTSSIAVAKKGKRPYKRKLENGPKRPLSAYNFFFRAEREKILTQEGVTINTQTTKKGKRAHRKSHGALNFSDMGKQIAAAWKALDETGRAPFVAAAAQDLKLYQKAKEEAMRQVADRKPTCNSKVDCEEFAPRNKIQNRETALHNNTAKVQTNVAQERIPHQVIKAFSPPNGTRKDEPSPQPTAAAVPQDYAYQCEVCCKAIFPTYDECLQHEQECAKKAERERQDQSEVLV